MRAPDFEERRRNGYRYCGCVETALGPERAVGGGRYSLAFVIKAVVDKTSTALPCRDSTHLIPA